VIHVLRASPLIIGGGAAWLVNCGWIVVSMQIGTVLQVAPGAMLKGWSAD
jgi:hypothetical protein